MSFDNVCKLLAEKYPRDFASWLLNQELGNVTVLKTELSIEPIRADFVTFLQTETQILHLEFQTTPESKPPIPLRMLDYYVRLTRLHQVPIIQVVIFLRETDDDRVFTSEYVSETTNHRYRVIRMWEQDSSLFLNNPALLPLAPLTRTNSPEDLLSRVAENIAKIEDRETQKEITACTEILAGLRFEKDLIYQLLREDIMQESVIYQDILQRGERRGELRGKRRGKRLGERRGIIRQLQHRFGEIDEVLMDKIKHLKIKQLDDLATALLDFSQITDLINWLNQHQS